MIGARPRRFHVGSMRHRILIEQGSKDIATGQPVETWTNRFANVPAAFEQVSGSETIRGRQVDAVVKAVFVIRYRDGITPQDRITFDGQVYGIVQVNHLGGYRQYLEIDCRADEVG